MTQKLGTGGLWSSWEGQSNPRNPGLWEVFSHCSHLYLVLWGSGPDTWGMVLAAPVKNNQCAQRDEHQAGQPQTEEVALRVVQGA